jgi:hypothetical protein
MNRVPEMINDVAAGQLLSYSSDEPFSVLGLESASLLVTAAISQ